MAHAGPVIEPEPMRQTLGTAGNKSLLGYRYDLGIPGYTGFMPSGMSIGLPTKGAVVHVGRPPSDKEIARMAGNHTFNGKQSEYDQFYNAAQPKDYYPSYLEGGQWQAQRNGEVVTNAKTHYGTTYGEEIDQAEQTAKHAHAVSEGMRPTLCYEKQAQTANLAGTRKPSKQIGYQTLNTSMQMQDPDVELHGPAAPGRVHSNPPWKPSDAARRERRTHRQREAQFFGATSYLQHYGQPGTKPTDNKATHHSEMTANATCSDLQVGTHAKSNHVPGYSGFIPIAQHNELAVTKGSLEKDRGDAKKDMLLCAMDQYPRNTLPGYQGYRNKAFANIKADLKEPEMRTGYNYVNADVWRTQPEAPSKENNLTSKDGTLSFFTGGAGQVSENGKHAAQTYYLDVRPIEGLPRMYYASRRTDYGAQYP